MGRRTWWFLCNIAFIASATACGSASSAGSAAPPRAQPPTAAQADAAVQTWFAATNQMVTAHDFSQLDSVTTGAMTDAYRNARDAVATQPTSSPAKPFVLKNLTVVVPCQGTGPADFVAYADTDVFSLGTSVDSHAMVFVKSGGRFKLAATVSHPPGSPPWPRLCRPGTAPSALALVLRPNGVGASLAQAFNRNIVAPTGDSAAVAPFVLNQFTNFKADSADASTKLQAAHDTWSTTFLVSPAPSYALPLASGGYWVLVTLAQHSVVTDPQGNSGGTWPDGAPVATPHPAVVHRQATEFTVTDAVIDPPSKAGARATVDGFFGYEAKSSAS